MSRAIEFLEAHQSPTPSRWREDAQWRRDNEYWLQYSQCITLQVLRAMDEQSVTQVELAKRMGCTQQYVSNLLKGCSNMTLETLARLENALSIDLILGPQLQRRCRHPWLQRLGKWWGERSSLTRTDVLKSQPMKV